MIHSVGRKVCLVTESMVVPMVDSSFFTGVNRTYFEFAFISAISLLAGVSILLTFLKLRIPLLHFPGSISCGQVFRRAFLLSHGPVRTALPATHFTGNKVPAISGTGASRDAAFFTSFNGVAPSATCRSASEYVETEGEIIKGRFVCRFMGCVWSRTSRM
jgi:hypothetical protein